MFECLVLMFSLDVSIQPSAVSRQWLVVSGQLILFKSTDRNRRTLREQ
ncbi:hypothetical protein [Moorena sp. SIOASIH]|nr:hypothetical protein [Moorena sp. SIOASIH]